MHHKVCGRPSQLECRFFVRILAAATQVIAVWECLKVKIALNLLKRSLRQALLCPCGAKALTKTVPQVLCQQCKMFAMQLTIVMIKTPAYRRSMGSIKFEFH